jgi:alpha-mannosidase
MGPPIHALVLLAAALPAPDVATLHCEGLLALVRQGTQTCQPIRVHVEYRGEPATGTVRVNGGEAATVRLGSGARTVDVLVPAVAGRTDAAVTLEAGGRVLARRQVSLAPVRKWVIYVLPHSHVDIGYTALQADVERKQIANITRGIELARQSAGYPEGARFRWNAEVLWAVDAYLRRAPPERRRAFVEAVRAGWVGLDALYGNTLTGLCRPEELIRLTAFAKELEARTGVPIESAMISDVPGYTWGTVPALAQAGVRYWSIGPNWCDRIGTTMTTWQDRPFYWVSPSGRERVLCWVPFRGYALGHLWKELTPHVFEDLARLEKTGYPYDVTYLRWNVNGDNGAPDETLADRVRAWNETYEYPRLVIATTAEAFRAFEKRYGDRLPQVRGDWTPYWEDGAGSSARETALNRGAAERLVQAETLFALRHPEQYPAERFRAAWRNVLLYSEHTWGAHNSITQPDSDFVKRQWAVKQAYALDADDESRRLLVEAAAPDGPAKMIDVFNTCSWPRTDLVLVPAELSAAGDGVIGADGQAVPAQRLVGGELAFVARDVPAFGARRYGIVPGPAHAAGTAAVRGTVLDNGLVSVRVDETSGAIVSLTRTGLAAELADNRDGVGLNAYRYLLGNKPGDARPNGPVRIEVVEKGPVVASLRITAAAPGCRTLTREVRVIDGLDRVDLVNTVDKLPVRAKEGVHFGFAFRVPGSTMRLDEPWAVVRPEVDQMPGACKDWLTVGRWADVSNAGHGVTWATLEAPLVEVGGLTATLIGSQTDPRAWRTKLGPSQTLYSWVMNNFWHTNYCADQEGPTVFRYSLRPHGAYAAIDAYRFGVGRSQPLVVAPAAGAGPAPPRLRIEPGDVVVTALKPSEDGRAWIVRLFGASGEPRSVRLTWTSPAPVAVSLSDAGERPGAPVTGPVEVPAWGIVTLRAERP